MRGKKLYKVGLVGIVCHVTTQQVERSVIPLSSFESRSLAAVVGRRY